MCIDIHIYCSCFGLKWLSLQDFRDIYSSRAAQSKTAIMASWLTADFKAKFQKQLDSTNQAPGIKFDGLMDLLREHKVSYKLKSVSPTLFLVHKANRGGLGLSPFNVHKNASAIYSVGANKAKLDSAFAIELAPSGDQLNSNIRFNQILVSKSNGLLAAVTGSEKYCTLGCGHTTAFCKLAAQGGPTSEANIADGNGKIDRFKLASDPTLHGMIEEGWDWEIIPFYIDEEYPTFAQVAQKALNASNHVASLVSELETAITLASTLEDQGMMANASDEKEWQELALQNVKSACMPCASYAHIIMKFVKQYAGGNGAPQIRFLDNVAKTFQCNVNLGETFWSVVTNQSFSSKLSVYPLVRTSLLLANLTSPKKEDGIARLLVKQDVVKLASKSKEKQCTLAEEALKVAMDMKASIVSSGACTEADLLKALGQMFTRVALWLCEKEKLGGEGKQYTMDEIKTLFVSAISTAVGYPVTIDQPGWKATVAPVKGDDTPGQQNLANMVTLDDHADPVFALKQKNIRLGQIVFERVGGSGGSQLFYVTKVGSEVGLTQVCSYSDQKKVVEVPADVMLSNWVIFKGDPPEKMTQSQCRNPYQFELDAMKASLYSAVFGADHKAMEKDSSGAVIFYRRPDVLYSAKKINKGALTLVPMAPLSNITTKDSANAVSLGVHPVAEEMVEFFISAPPKPACLPLNPASVQPGSSMIAFWWVGTTANKKEATLELSEITQNGFTIPVLTNTSVLPPHTPLLKFKAKAAAPIQLKGAKVIAGEASQPSKKLKSA